MKTIQPSSLLSQFRSIASVTACRKDVAVVFSKTGTPSGALTSRQLSNSRESSPENFETRQLLYRALSESGASSDLLAKVFKALELGNPEACNRPLSSRTVFEVLTAHAQEEFEMVADRDDGFVEISRRDNLLAPNEQDAVRGPETLRTRDKLKAFILDHADHKGIRLMRADLAKLKVADLRAVARLLMAGKSPSEATLRNYIARQSNGSGQVLQNETLDALARLKTDKVFADSVTFSSDFKEVKGGASLKDFLADLILDFDVAEHDSVPSAQRMAKTLLKHAKILPMILWAPESVLKLQLPISAFSTFRVIRQHFAAMLGVDIDPQTGKMTVLKDEKVEELGLIENSTRVEALVKELKNCVESGTVSKRITAFDWAVQRHVTRHAENMQKLMDKLFGAIMTGEPPDVGEMVSSLDPELLTLLEKWNVPLPVKVAAPNPEKAPFGVQKLSLQEVKDLYAKKKTEAQTEIAKLTRKYDETCAEIRLRFHPPELEQVEDAVARLERDRDQHLASFRESAKNGGFTQKQIDDNLAGISATYDKEIARLKDMQSDANSVQDEEAQLTQAKNAYELQIAPWFEKLAAAEKGEGFSVDEADFEFIGAEGHYRKLTPAELEKLGNGVEREEYDLWHLSNTQLNDLAKPGIDPSMGYGKFLMDAVEMYFKSSQQIDQRAMLASMIRNAPIKDQVTNALRPGGAQALFGAMLGAYFKGAGPLMQKQLQMFSSMPGLPSAFKDALADMRSNLPPMSTETVHALLADVVAKSNGQIKKLEVLETLGAASVAQSVLCKMTTSNGETREVVVKLIRPDAENRVEREKELFLEAAKKNGMRKTFEGRLKTIYEEFELGIEQKNAKAGVIYDKPGVLTHYRPNSITAMGKESFSDVHSVKIDPLSPPSGSAMIMSVAPGMPVDRMMAAAEKELAELQESEAQLDPLDGDARRNSIRTLKRRYLKVHTQVEQSYRQMAHFMRTWLGQALFGSGFYHGDAHAGNLMVDLETDPKKNKGLTVIDFGNATQLTKDESKNIKLVMTACFISNLDDFISSYRAMLSPEGAAHFAANENTIRAHLERIFAKGSGAADAGDIAMAALSELQRMGVETPSALFNFMQGFTLLIGTMSQLDVEFMNVHQALMTFEENHPDSDFEEAEQLKKAKSSKVDYPIGEILMGVIRENIVATGFVLGPSGIVKVAKALKKA